MLKFRSTKREKFEGDFSPTSGAMVAYMTGIYVLLLSICHLKAARIVDSSELEIQRGSLTQKNGVSEEYISRNPHRFERMSNKIPPARNCKDAISCNGELNEAVNIQKPFLGSPNNDEENKADDSSGRLKLEENCPIGLWCVRKQKRGYENSATLDHCPPGLWCKRNGLGIIKDLLTKRVNKKQDDKRCPSGFQCTFKRKEGHENFESLNQCPPGLWCKRDAVKSQDDPKETSIDKIFCPTGFKCSSKREAGFENYVTIRQCPPGLWCKKNMIATKHDITATVNDIVEDCPKGLKCSGKRLAGYKNSETLDQCPPGLWCKRSVPAVDSIFTQQSDHHCSSGPWCALKQDVANTARDVLDQCPPGLWCKRYIAKNQHISSEH